MGGRCHNQLLIMPLLSKPPGLQVSRRDTTALLASFFMAIVPAYVSRSTAGAFDNEAVAIFAFVLTLFMWLRALSSGRIAWAAATAIAFFFMAASWGGYVLALNV